MTRSDSKTNAQQNLNNVNINPLLGTNSSQSALNVQVIAQQPANASGQTVLSGKQDKKRKKQLSQLFYVNNASGAGNPIQGGSRVLLLLRLWFFWCIAKAFLEASVRLSIDDMLNFPAIATD